MFIEELVDVTNIGLRLLNGRHVQKHKRLPEMMIGAESPEHRVASSSLAVTGVSGTVCSRLCGRSRFGAPREVRLALFQESRERLFCVFGADLHTELFILGLHRGLDLLAR
jgi:hypothetical protein